MWQSLKNLVYDVIVWSGIINILLLMKPLLQKIFFFSIDLSNATVRDDSGHTMKAVKLNGKTYPPFGEAKLRGIPDFKIRVDDILLCGYPKTGCHWMFEILHMMATGEAKLSRHGKELGGMIDAIPDIILDSLPSPRILNSHLFYDELPKGIKHMRTKIILTIRNPKDTVVSFYNHHKNLKFLYGYEGTFEDYFKLFVDGSLEYGSYFDYTLDWDRVMKSQTDNPILLVKFEDIKSRPLESVHEVAKFLNIPISDKFAADIIEACDFSKMKEKRTKQGGEESKVFRKGKVGDWKNWLTNAQSEAIDRVWKEKMQGCTYQPAY